MKNYIQVELILDLESRIDVALKELIKQDLIDPKTLRDGVPKYEPKDPAPFMEWLLLECLCLDCGTDPMPPTPFTFESEGGVWLTTSMEQTVLLGLS